HDYYHLPLVALAALGLGVAAHTAVDRVRATSWSPPGRRAVLGVGAALLLVTGAAFATGTRALGPPIGTAAHHVAANREIGELTGHSRRVLALTPTYGADLAFDGRVVVRE